jgi:hypothetical protein
MINHIRTWLSVIEVSASLLHALHLPKKHGTSIDRRKQEVFMHHWIRIRYADGDHRGW